MSYTVVVTDSSSPQPAASLRAEQVAQTRAALVSAGRVLFGSQGFAATSVEDIARQARVTTGALYHHFPTKAAVFEAVFEAVHADLMTASLQAGAGATDAIDLLTAGFGVFLDKVLEPEVQRIVVSDGPAVLGLSRFIELDERHAFEATVAALELASAQGVLLVPDPQTLARLLLGTLTRAGVLIAGSAEPERTRDQVAATLRVMLNGFAVRPEKLSASPDVSAGPDVGAGPGVSAGRDGPGAGCRR